MKYIISGILFSLLNLLLANDINATIKPKYLYLKYTSYPKQIYQNQIFSFELKANILYKQDYIINTKITPYQNLAFLNDEIIWYKKNNIITTKIDFKATDKKPIFPTFVIELLDKNGTLIDSQTILPPNIEFKVLQQDELFSKVIAKDLKVLFTKTKQYSNNELLTYIELQATNSNLEDFRLSNLNLLKQTLLSHNHIKTLKLSIITPLSKKELQFTYFNTTNKEYTLVTIPLFLKDELVSTQTNINPNSNDLLIYKQMILIGIILILLIIFLWIKQKIVIFWVVLVTCVLIYISLPNQKINIPKGTKIYILPTSNSNIFKITNKVLEVEVLLKKENYIKILLPNNTVGWIKK